MFDYVINNKKSDHSRSWINSFDNSFSKFVHRMGYNHLVDTAQNGEYYITDYITGKPIESLKTLKTVNKEYIKELQNRINRNATSNFY